MTKKMHGAKDPVLVVYGPTGVGKTLFSLLVAERIPAEIINMDVGQLYAPLTVGTAKPDLRTVSVPHHGFDLLREPRNFTVVAYRDLCEQLIAEIRARGNMPILVGGSGFYLKSLLFPQCELIDSGSSMEQDTEVSEAGITHTADEGGEWIALQQIDPVRASQIHPHDSYRIQRALAIWAQTKQKPSRYKPTFDPLPAMRSATVIFLTRDRQELYQRINERVSSMLEEGWLDEVRSVIDSPWKQFIKQKKLIGYNELVDVLENDPHAKDITSDVVSAIRQRTRNYAKRQSTYWRMLTSLYEQVPMEQKKDMSLSFSSINLTMASGIECGERIADKLSNMRQEAWK